MSVSGSALTRRSDFSDGLRAIAPLVVAAFPIALVFGALAAQKGLSPFETMLMSSVVFAGGSQFVAIDFWATPVPWVAITISALLVNIRHVLMSASLGAKTKQMGFGWQLIAFGFLADEVWALSEHRARKQGTSFAFMMGLAIPFYVNWLVMTGVGASLGTLLADLDPAKWGFDFAFPAIFIGLIMGFWQGQKTGVILGASGVAAIACKAFVPGAWYIAAGAVAGVLVAAVLADPESLEA
ncbi:AzlC family ABC transporter permease [Maritalea porphyrae]|uniref:AzlC family ABC transporter permease n=1 Tax=Maritalea porphyrae TaxID=880732 RepID=UPI0022AF0180|nr:AzlC family ABC transporter permease [Maritalea porphyrae]MCZ4272588.1 AzlC family ABC transporter permease [Maritalea porphyrae]